MVLESSDHFDEAAGKIAISAIVIDEFLLQNNSFLQISSIFEYL